MAVDAGVRRCAGCGAEAMVCVSVYERSGISLTGDITDWVCQRCGRPVTLHAIPWMWVPIALMSLPLLPMGMGMALWAIPNGEILMLGLAGLPMLAMPVGLSAAVLWPWWSSRSNPVVPDAPRPELRFRETQPRRRCRCHGSARCVKVTASRVNGVYTGTEYEYRCERCEQTFTVESPLSALLAVGGGGFLGALAALLWPDSWAGAEWSEVLIVGVIALLAVFSVGMAVTRVLARVRYPLVGLPLD